MSFLSYILILISLFCIELLYFKIADHFNIIDKPNSRSSHTSLVIRGGGIIYVIAALLALALYPENWMPILGLLIIGVISFIDDRITLSSKIRFFFHLLAVSLLFSAIGVFKQLDWWLYLAAYIFVIGIINAYNFMDGINGITGLYSLVVLAGLQYVNMYISPFIAPDLIWLPILASLVFLFFNFRTRAKCFAGDVGSISIAFWIVWLLLALMLKTANYSYILFLTVYGVDSVLTIIHRLWLKQNIFKAHRLHFYQLLANECKISHLVVSTFYGVLQLIIIVLVIYLPYNFATLFLLMLLPLVLTYVFIKPCLMSKHPSMIK